MHNLFASSFSIEIIKSSIYLYNIALNNKFLKNQANYKDQMEFSKFCPSRTMKAVYLKPFSSRLKTRKEFLFQVYYTKRYRFLSSIYLIINQLVSILDNFFYLIYDNLYRDAHLSYLLNIGLAYLSIFGLATTA